MGCLGSWHDAGSWRGGEDWGMMFLNITSVLGMLKECRDNEEISI